MTEQVQIQNSIEEFIKTLPKDTLETITSIVTKADVTKQEVLQEYYRFFNDEKIFSQLRFETLEEKHAYCIKVIWTRYMAKPPQKPYDLLTFGFDASRKTKAGRQQAALYIAVKGNKGMEKKRVVLNDEQAKFYKEVNMFSGYNGIKLGAFGNGKDFIADSRTRFENPKPINISLDKLWEMLGIPRITVSQAPKMVSIIDQSGYVDKLDLRIIRGIISGTSIFLRKGDKTKGAVIRVADMSINTESSQETQLSSEGNVVRTTISVWSPIELANNGDYSECDFLGTINTNKEGDTSMNAINIIPIHAIPLTQESEPTETDNPEPD